MSNYRLYDILKRLAYGREQAGLSQGQVATLLGYTSAATISHYESGLRTLSLEQFLKLCEVYGISEFWALTGLNPDFDPQPIMEASMRTKIVAEDLDKILDLLSATTRNGNQQANPRPADGGEGDAS